MCCWSLKQHEEAPVPDTQIRVLIDRQTLSLQTEPIKQDQHQ